MVLNLYKVRVYGGLILGPFITVLSFFIVLNFYGFLWSLCGLLVGLGFSVLLGKLFIKNPFSDMLEGNGILCLNIDSTGIIRPFVVGVKSPYIFNKKEGVDDVFDREAVMQMAVPVNSRLRMVPKENGGVRIALDQRAMIKIKEWRPGGVLELERGEFRILSNKKGRIRLMITDVERSELVSKTRENVNIIDLDEKEYNAGRFALFHYPCLIFNDQIKSILTKDFLSGQEKEAFAEHGILYLNRKMEELTSVVRDFGRHVVELTRPKKSLFSNWWVWAIIAVFVVVLLAMFAPAVITAIKGVSGNVGASFSQAAGSGASITPR